MTSSIVDGRTGSDKVSELARSHPSLVALRGSAGWPRESCMRSSGCSPSRSR